MGVRVITCGVIVLRNGGGAGGSICQGDRWGEGSFFFFKKGRQSIKFGKHNLPTVESLKGWGSCKGSKCWKFNIPKQQQRGF